MGSDSSDQELSLDWQGLALTSWLLQPFCASACSSWEWARACAQPYWIAMCTRYLGICVWSSGNNSLGFLYRCLLWALGGQSGTPTPQRSTPTQAGHFGLGTAGLQFLAPRMLAVQPRLVTKYLCASFLQVRAWISVATMHQEARFSLQWVRAAIFPKGAHISKPDSPPLAGLRRRIHAGRQRRRLRGSGAVTFGKIQKNRVWRWADAAFGTAALPLLAGRGQAEPTSRIVLGSPQPCGCVPGHAARLCAAS